MPFITVYEDCEIIEENAWFKHLSLQYRYNNRLQVIIAHFIVKHKTETSLNLIQSYVVTFKFRARTCKQNL
jgi:hypothetical protein